MEYQIAIEPELGLTAAQFIEAWNASEYAQHGKAQSVTQASTTFMTPEMGLVVVGAAVGIPASIIASFVTEYLKSKFLKSAKRATVTTIATADGQPLYIIKQEEQ